MSFGYIKQGQSNRMSIPASNDATGVSGTGSVLGYNLKLICFILSNLMLILNTCTCLVSLTIVMEILFNYIVNFGIKVYWKMPRSLTIQKPEAIGFRYLALLQQSNHPLLMVPITNVGMSGLYYG